LRPIFINGRFVTQKVTGTQRYAHELLTHLDAKLDAMLAKSQSAAKVSGPPVTLLVPPSDQPLPTYRSIRVLRAGRFNGQLWEQLELPFYARGGILLTLVGGAPLLHGRNIITIHDAAVFAAPESFSPAFRLWYQFLYKRLCRNALHLFTVSQFSRAELVKWCGAKPEKITVTSPGSQHALRPVPDPGVLTRNNLRPFKYVLAVGSRNPSKNLNGLLSAIPYLKNMDLDVAIVGASYAKVFGTADISGERVCDLGYVTDSELRSLYGNAACFAFPSFYEGFGLPPLEALALGCPTVVADGSSLAETFCGVAFLCNPNDPADIAAKILQACRSPQQERRRYREFTDGFRWDECATIAWTTILRIAAIEQPHI
jgi:glycosyltransferase involved in cell wall biosynthesis